jgi:predicted Zn-dependent protease with MMP-like domain
MRDHRRRAALARLRCRRRRTAVMRTLSGPRMLPPTIDEVARLAREQLSGIPAPFRRHFRDVVIRVAEFCDEETEHEMGLESPFDLLGLYRGISLDRKSIAERASDLDTIFLYRRPILDYWCETGEDLARIIRHVLIHEVGHHFGLSDEDMQRIEDDE